METRFHVDPVLGGVFMGWHNVEGFIFSVRDRKKYCLPSTSWCPMYESSPYLLLASPLVLTYHTEDAIMGSAYVFNTIAVVMASESAVLCLIFLARRSVLSCGEMVAIHG